MKPSVYIAAAECLTPMGKNLEKTWQQILEGRSGISARYWRQQTIYTAAINDDLECLENSLNIDLKGFTRFEIMLALVLQPLVEKFGVKDRSILIISTTKGNIGSLKGAQQVPDEAFLQNSAKKIATAFHYKTLPIVLSNACVSGLMALSVAKNLIECGQCDEAFVIAADEISDFVLSGFNAFQAMSDQPCKPYDAARNGITLGEAAASAYVTKNRETGSCFEILGDSSINDANHISGPSRTGEGLYKSISNALAEARISADALDLISAHGTATIYNDEMESIAFSRAGLQRTPVNSLKGYFGHTLGAAGLLEALVSMKAAQENMLIRSANFENSGTSEPLLIITEHRPAEINTFLKTASGFGGSNTAMVFRKC